MRNERKIKYLTQYVDKLEKENLALKQENQGLSKQLETNKNTISLRQQELDKKEKQLENTKKTYEKSIAELQKTKADYEKAMKIAKEAKKKYEAKIADLLKRLHKQK